MIRIRMDRPVNVFYLYKTIFVFQQNLLKLGEVVAHNIIKFYQILMKNKKVLYITHLPDGLSIKGR